ncbi:MAG TPA: DUF1223 domain-containing protein [Ginsengibacter sp.]
MKKFGYLILSVGALLILWFCISSSRGKDKETASNIKADITASGSKSIAVLELFTSQGCSSCPPADRLLGSYSSKENVIVLSFHVDYWNRLGWKDPFSSKEYTQRQYDYASALHADVYTPQLIINGQAEMIGSDADKISNAINKVLGEQPDATLSIKTVKAENARLPDGQGKADIKFDVSGNTSNSILHIALVEKKTTTNVNAGENGGATLTNYNVVRTFKSINKVADGDNAATIDIPSSAELKDLSVVLFLQQKKNNKISAADQANF